MITLNNLDRAEAVRYLGGAGLAVNDSMQKLLDECEAEVLRRANPKYLYQILDLPCSEIMRGNDIADHLSGCTKAVLMCATLGGEVDRLIRIAQISDMARAVVLDSFASVAVEQLCNKVDELIAERYPDYHMTFRFSPGYGDYPIELQKYFLSRLDAPRKIGLNTDDSYILIPSKSITAVAGLLEFPIEKKKRGCAVCNLRGRCQYRRNGEHCGF